MTLVGGFHLPQLQMHRDSIGNPLPSILGSSKKSSPEDGARTRLPALRGATYTRVAHQQGGSLQNIERHILRSNVNSGSNLQASAATGSSKILQSSQSSINHSLLASSSGGSYAPTPLLQSQVGSSSSSPIAEGLTGITLRDSGSNIVSTFKYKGGEITAIDRMIRMYTSHNLGSIYELRRAILGCGR